MVNTQDETVKKAKMSGNRQNPRKGIANRHDGHMSSSVAASGVHGTPRNVYLNLKQQDDHHHEESFHRSRSFCGGPSQTGKTWEAFASSSSSKLKKNTTTMMRRPKTHPELLNRDDHNMKMKMKTNNPVDQALSATKLLVNVTVAHSIGPLRLLVSKDATVEDVIKAALVLYAKEGRKPLLSNDLASFGLHYSQFSIDCLNPADKIKDLGSRNFFLCPEATAKEKCRLSFKSEETGVNSSSSYSCGKEIRNISRIREPWYNKLLDCLLLPP